MIKRILQVLFGKPKNWKEEYLAQSKDHYDLERRHQEIDRSHNKFWI